MKKKKVGKRALKKQKRIERMILGLPPEHVPDTADFHWILDDELERKDRVVPDYTRNGSHKKGGRIKYEDVRKIK